VTWRALLNLKPQAQLAVLSGQPDALLELAKELLDWFIYKLDLRLPHLHLPGNQLIQVLSRIALSTQIGQMDNKIWIDLASQTYGDRNAYELLIEAELSGLISFGSITTWSWQYPFVYEYLIMQSI
jgi:hypothetical protein